MNTAASIALVCLSALGQPGAARTARTDSYTIPKAILSAFDEVQIPAREAGVLKKFESNNSLEGTEVAENSILGYLDDEDLLAKKESAELEIQVAVAQAESDAELKAAQKTKEVAEAEVKAAEDANRKSPNVVPQNEIRRLRLTVERAGFEIELRKVERANAALTAKLKRAQLKAVEVEISRRVIVSPLDGVIVERLKHEGEWVQPGETIMKVVRLNRLRVEGYVPAKTHSPRELTGAKVMVSVEVPTAVRGETRIEQVEGVIAFVNPIVELSGEYRVWAEIKNRKDAEEGHWVFRPGSVASMDIFLRSGVATKPVTTPRFTRTQE